MDILSSKTFKLELIGDVNFDHTIDIQDLLRISDYLIVWKSILLFI